jgi:hypothetical protein
MIEMEVKIATFPESILNPVNEDSQFTGIEATVLVCFWIDERDNNEK